MKMLLILSLLFALDTSLASTRETKNISFRCVTGMPTTSFVVKTEGDQVVLTTVHHNGTDYMPIHEGIVVPKDFEYLAEKAKALTLLGDRVEFRFPLANCSVYAKGLMSCHGNDKKVVDGVEFQALSFNTKIITHRVYDYSIDTHRVSLSLKTSVITPVIEVMNSFSETECKFQF